MARTDKTADRILKLFEVAEGGLRQQWEFINQKGCDFSNDNQLYAEETKSLEEQGMPNAQIWKIKRVDEEMLNNWKTTVIQKFVNSCPMPFRTIIRFRTWDEAMQILTEYLKRERGV